ARANGVCGARLIAMKRGRKMEQVYVCSGHRDDSAACPNTSGVPADLIHIAVIQSLNKTSTPESFEAHARAVAGDEQARESRRAERETLLARIPVLEAEATRLADAIAAGNGTMDVLLNAIKARQTEREQAEARVAELEGIERDLQADVETIERLKATWGDWSGALVADPILARQVLRKVLAEPIYVAAGRGRQRAGLAVHGARQVRRYPARLRVVHFQHGRHGHDLPQGTHPSHIGADQRRQ